MIHIIGDEIASSRVPHYNTFEHVPTPQRQRIISWAGSEFLHCLRVLAPIGATRPPTLTEKQFYRLRMRCVLAAESFAMALKPNPDQAGRGCCPAGLMHALDSLHSLFHAMIERWRWSGSWSWRQIAWGDWELPSQIACTEPSFHRRTLRGERILIAHVIGGDSPGIYKAPIERPLEPLDPDEVHEFERLLAQLPSPVDLPATNLHICEQPGMGGMFLSRPQIGFREAHDDLENLMISWGDEIAIRHIRGMLRLAADPVCQDLLITILADPDCERVLERRAAEDPDVLAALKRIAADPDARLIQLAEEDVPESSESRSPEPRRQGGQFKGPTHRPPRNGQTCRGRKPKRRSRKENQAIKAGAIAIRMMHPNWTHEEVAISAGCSARSVQRWASELNP